jgi:hypothetical protein
MKKLLLWPLLICLIAFFGCDRVEIDFFQLGPFRLMALVIDQPEVDATQENTVSLTPWISDIEAQGRTLTVNIRGCLDPGIGLGIEPQCDADNPTTQTIDYADYNTENLESSLYTGAMPSVDITIPADLLAGLPQAQQEEGVDYLIVCEFEAGTEVFRSFKRVRLSTNSQQDTNPIIETILINGQVSSDGIPDGAQIDFTIDPNTPPQKYERLNDQGQTVERTEEYLMTWFVYGGFLSFSRTEPDLSNEFTLDETLGNQTLVVGVLRDGRAGSDVMMAGQ